jgi:hypothetical protein
VSAGELFALFLHFLSLSVFATGGAMALASDMHRYVVEQHGYITHIQFVNSIALEQAAPGPNVLFVTVMGWQIAQLPGAIATTLGCRCRRWCFRWSCRGSGACRSSSGCSRRCSAAWGRSRWA